MSLINLKFLINGETTMFTQRQNRLASLRQNRLASLRSKKAEPIFSHDSLDELEDTASAIVDTINQLWKLVGKGQQALYKVSAQAQNPEDAYVLKRVQNDLEDIKYPLNNMLKKAEEMSETVSDEVFYLRKI